MKNESTVGQRIKDARERAGMTQSELAKKLNYSSPTAISLIEADERSVRVEMLERVAEVLHQDVNYLATGKKEAIPTIKTALRADKNLNPSDVNKIESYIDYLMAEKAKQQHERGTNKK